MTMKRVKGPASAAFIKAMKDLQDATVRVGWFESSKYPDDKQMPVAYVAAINELGPHARPFMRPTADSRDKEWSALMLRLSKRIVTGKMSAEDGLTAIGLQAGGDVQKTIATITEPPLSLITLMARAARRDGRTVTGGTIGEFAAEIKEKGESKIRSELGGISEKPLNDTGYMLATVSISVNMEEPKKVDGS